MNKKTKYNYFIIGIVLLVFIALLSSQSLVQESAFLSGTGVLSVQKVELINGFKDLTAPVWLLTVSPSTLGQRYYTETLTSDEAQEFTSDTQTTSKTTVINAEITNEQCVYPLTSISTERTINYYDLKEFSSITCPFYTDNQIANKLKEDYGEGFYNSLVYVGKYPYSTTCYGISKTTSVPATKLLEASYTRVLGSISLSVDGTSLGTFYLDTEKKYKTPTETTQYSTSEGYIGTDAYVEWAGNLVNENCAGYTNYRAALVNNKFTPILQSSYDTYINTEDNMNNLLGLSAATYSQTLEPPTQTEIKYWTSLINSKASSALKTQTITNGYVDGSNLRVEQTNLIASPIIKIWVEADKLGIYTPETKGSIISVSNTKFSSAQAGTVDVVIKNTGIEDGTYDVGGQCPSPATSQTVRVGVRAGEQATVSLIVSGTSSTTTIGSCTVKLISGGNLLDQKSFSFTITPVSICTTDFCSIDNGVQIVQGCSNGELYLKDTCVAGETCSNSQCVSDGGYIPTPVDPTLCSSSYFSAFYEECDVCDSKFSGILSSIPFIDACETTSLDSSLIYGILIGLGGALFAYLMLMKQFPPSNKDKEMKYIFMVLAGVVGILLYKFSSTVIEHWIITTIFVGGFLLLYLFGRSILARFGL